MKERVLSVLESINEEIPGYEGDNMFEDGLLDSYRIMNLIAELEDEFDIEIDAKYIKESNFKTKEDVIALIIKICGC